MDETNFILQYFETPYYYGEDMEVALPTRLPRLSEEAIVIDKTYTPAKYCIAHYVRISENRFVTGEPEIFMYRFDGIEIR